MKESGFGQNMAGGVEGEMKFWAETARIKAEEVIKGLNPQMTVEVFHGLPPRAREAGIEIDDKGWYLDFSHPQKPNLYWRFQIQSGEDYLNDVLPGAIREMYERKVDEIAWRPTDKA